MRRYIGLLVMLGAILVALGLAQPAVAWRFGPAPWGVLPWVPVAPFPAALPYGSRFYYPPGVPLSYYEPGSGSTYCLSQPTGMYYVCGYSPTGLETVGLAYRMPPAPVGGPPLGEQGLPAPSGVLIFRLPGDAEAAVDGAPVGLSQGLGITSVAPGPHRVTVRASGIETERTVAVSPHAIFTVTPTVIVPTGP